MIEAVFFDIGGVLEAIPATGWQQRWADELGLSRDDFERRLGPLWRPGATKTASIAEIEQQTAHKLKINQDHLQRLTADFWAEYLGTLNRELARYFAALRPRLRTGMISNSVAGAREREQSAYGFEDMCDPDHLLPRGWPCQARSPDLPAGLPTARRRHRQHDLRRR